MDEARMDLDRRSGESRMNGRHALVTVVMITYNRADLAARAAASVLSQTSQDFELVVVDDCSTDETRDVIQALQDPRIVYIRHDVNRGASAARNTGMSRAQGDYIALLDDDDEWLPAKLEKQLRLIESSRLRPGLVYCWMEYLQGGSHLRYYTPQARGNIFDQILNQQCIGNSSTVLMTRPAVERVGRFDETLVRGTDGDYFRRLAQRFPVDFVPEVLVKYHIDHPLRATSDSKQGVLNAMRSEERKLEKFKLELASRPNTHAAILRRIAGHWEALGESERAQAALVEAARLERTRRAVLAKAFGAFSFALRRLAART
jgi:glycosyltransferase involved in cell wall biosynthesis